MIDIIIPTKNNPIALATLLGSLHGCFDEAWRIHVVDASDVPVITLPQMARTLLPFNVSYRHRSNWTDVNHQRIFALEEMASCDLVLFIDDDHVLHGGYDEALSEAAGFLNAHATAYAIFGVSVDICNEKHYPDYKVWGSQWEAHAFSPNSQIAESNELRTFAANPGHVLVRRDIAIDCFRRAMEHSDKPELVDDAVALALARSSRLSLVHTGMRAWHLGNGNSNWKTSGYKHALVEELYTKTYGENDAHHISD